MPGSETVALFGKLLVQEGQNAGKVSQLIVLTSLPAVDDFGAFRSRSVAARTWPFPLPSPTARPRRFEPDLCALR
ncbi:hypothetical protein GGTG_13290 [Gaeumannomyces tritici R3-111a-1]|uniref:Uncharacterized protein n=1 Tax=Gaeumannomyces tritici (strain R3-111a-1) TaxID=644352 RepID=J3PIG2_GAET3|nr:hypothetical protein GGTG_13290 [Gaeumannomyces tritici R3-111a-1]EJT69181.1 hypothetical protein GGTG_13290 [Gaeumannomyces tritici R3-111a-1]